MQTTHRPASVILGVSTWASRLVGMPDDWTALCVDKCVSWFGVWIENQQDDEHSLQDLLREDDEVNAEQMIEQLTMIPGLAVRKARVAI